MVVPGPECGIVDLELTSPQTHRPAALGVESLPVLARPADLCMSNLAAKSGVDILLAPRSHGAVSGTRKRKATGCTPLGYGHSAGTGDWQSSTPCCPSRFIEADLCGVRLTR